MPWRGRQRSPGAGRAAPKRGWGETWITSCVIDKQGNCQCSLAQTAEARRASSRSLTASSTARRVFHGRQQGTAYPGELLPWIAEGQPLPVAPPVGARLLLAAGPQGVHLGVAVLQPVVEPVDHRPPCGWPHGR